MVNKPKTPQELLDNLNKIAGKPTTRSSAQSKSILAGLDANPYAKGGYVKPTRNVVWSNELDKALPKDVSGVGQILKGIMAPLQIIDTPRRAVISGVRELVDVLDSDPNTKASFGDWYNQTKDTNYGFGQAFPMKGWAGRVIGFAGDILLDPLTYATLGGTVAKSATFAKDVEYLDDAGRLVKGVEKASTRGVLGKTVIGREGRQKLAEFSRQRLQRMVEQGVRDIPKGEIDNIIRDIAAQGKRAMPEYLAKDLGLKGPGVYYFGSRVKVPGSGALGKMLETGITKSRLGIVNSRLIEGLHEAITPKGVGRIAQFGPNEIRDLRVGLAAGKFDPEKAAHALSILEIDDARRLNVSKFSESAATLAEKQVEAAGSTSVPVHQLLDGVPDASLVTSNVDDIAKAQGMRQVFDSLHASLDARAAEVGAAPVGYVTEGYFPRMETDEMMRLRLKLGEDGVDKMLYGGVVDKTRTASSFKSRMLKAGDNWFGHTLTEADLKVDVLNNMAKNAINGYESVGVDVFETNVNKVMSKYVRSYAEQMATYGMVEDFTKRRPDLLSFLDTNFKPDPAFMQESMIDAPQRAMNDTVASLRDLTSKTENSMEAVRHALELQHGSLDAAKQALIDGTLSEADSQQLGLVLGDIIDNTAQQHSFVNDTAKAFDTMLENKDGVSNYQLLVNRRNQAQADIARIKSNLDSILYEDVFGKQVKRDVVDKNALNTVLEDLTRHSNDLQTLERDFADMATVHDVLPVLGAHADLGGAPVYDAIKKLQTAKGVASTSRVAEESMIKGWTPEAKVAVAAMDNSTAFEIMSRVVSSDIPSEVDLAQMETVGKYVQAQIIQGEKSAGLNDFINHAGNGVKTNQGVRTRFGEWQDAMDALRGGDRKKAIYALQDMLHQEQSYAQYRQWKEMLDPYGIKMGDDVVDEILKRNVEPLVLDAIRRRDSARLEELLKPGFGRNNIKNADHPFSSYRRVVEATKNVDDGLAEIRTWNLMNKGMESAPILDKHLVEYESLSPAQKKTYTKWSKRINSTMKLKSVENANLQVGLSRLDTRLNSVRNTIDSITGRMAEAFKVIRNEPLDASTRDLRRRFISNPDNLIKELQTILSDVPNGSEILRSFQETNRDLLNVLKQHGSVIDSLKPGTQEYDAIRTALIEHYGRIDATIALQKAGDVRSGFAEVLLQSFNDHVDKAFTDVVHELNTERGLVVQKILDVRQAHQQAFLYKQEIGPKKFFASTRGRVELQDTIRSIEPASAVQPGQAMSDVKDLRVLRELHSEMLNSDAYVVAKIEQNDANIAHILADLNDSVDFNGIRFTPQEWDAIVNGDQIGQDVSGKLRAVINIAKREQTLQVTAPGQLLDLGPKGISDEFALKAYVQHVMQANPENVADSVVANARKARIIKQWEKTAGYKHLTELNSYKARLLNEAQLANKKLPQRVLDRTSHAAQELIDANTAEARRLAEWTPQQSDELAKAVNDVLGMTSNAQELGKTFDNLPKLQNVEFSPQAEQLMNSGKQGLDTIKRIIKAEPIEQKSLAQLQEELKILEELKSRGVQLEGVKLNEAIRGRRKQIDLLLPQDKALEAQAKKKIAELQRTLVDKSTDVAQEAEAKAALDNAINPGSGAWEQVTGSADIVERAKNEVANVMDQSPVFTAEGNLASDFQDPLFNNKKSLDAVNKTRVVEPYDVNPVKTEVNPKGLEKLQRDLTAAYDPIATAINPPTSPQLLQIEQDMRRVSGLIDTLDKTITANAKNPGVADAAEFSVRAGQYHARYDTAKQVLADAMALIKHVASKDQMDAIDAVLVAQAQAEVHFWENVAKTTDAELGMRMSRGVQQMLDGGGTLMADGRVRLATGEIFDGVPVDAVTEAYKSVRDGWSVLDAQYFPGLQASPEFRKMWDAAARMEDPVFVRKLAYYLGPYTKAWKAFATLSPGFHVRNAIANAVQLVTADADIENMIKGTPLFFKWARAKAAGMTTEEFLKTLEPSLVPHMSTAIDGALGGGGGIFTDTFKEATGGSRIYDNWLIRKNQMLGQKSDDYSRFILAFDTSMKGGDAGLAQARVKRYFFDYEDLSTVDKAMRQIIPFWLFMSRNMHTQVTNMWLNPKFYQMYGSFKRNFADTTTANPPFVDEMSGFRLPFGTGLFAMPDLGFSRVPQELSLLGHPEKLLTKMNPLISVPAQQILGRNAYNGKDYATPQDRLKAALTGFVPPAQQADKLANTEGLSQLNAWLGYLGSPVRKYNN